MIIVLQYKQKQITALNNNKCKINRYHQINKIHAIDPLNTDLGVVQLILNLDRYLVDTIVGKLEKKSAYGRSTGIATMNGADESARSIVTD